MYDKVLATIHDKWFNDLSENAAQLILNEIAVPIGPIVDLGCGSGNLLASCKHKIPEGYGFDISPEMIKLSKEKNPNYEFQVAGLFESQVPNAQLITCVGEILSYAAFGKNDLDRILKSFFGSITTKLTEDGIFLFDFLSDELDYNYTKSFDLDEYSVSMISVQVQSIVTREITSLLKTGELKHVSSKEIHHLIVFNIEKIMEILFEVGLEVKVLDNYQNFPLLPGRKACFCRVHNV